MPPAQAPDFDLRRLEEVSQNASRPDRGLMIDGWSVGLSRGVAKRSRCINAFYRSARPFARNLADARAAYAQAGLPCVFRLTPFVDDPALDERLAGLGYRRFDAAIVMALDLADLRLDHVRPSPLAIVDETDLALAAARVADLRGDDADEMHGLAARWQLAAAQIAPQFAMAADCATTTDADFAAVASSVAIAEGDHVGIFDVVTAPSWRGRGLAAALIGGQLARARAAGARVAYLQVRADNPARRLYERFGFAAVYEYWYRALPGEDR